MVQMLTPVRDYGNVKMISSTTSGPKCIKIPQSKLGGGGVGTQSWGGWGGESPTGLYTAGENVKNVINDCKESKRAVFVRIPCAIWGCEMFYSFFFIVFFCRSYILYHKFYLRYLLYFFIILNLSLAFFEKPALKGASLPFWVCPFLSETQTLSLTFGKYVYM